jgi:transcriptional regulator with XRE-family HTH domain
MSSKNLTNVENSDFVARFIEVCGSSQPAEIARLLNISYQAAKNYLQGRLPDSNVLMSIAEQTPYSIHWLLTGNGKKYVEVNVEKDTLILSDQLIALIKEECRKNVGELLSHSKENAQRKVIVLKSEDIKEEKIIQNSDSVLKESQ